MISREKLAEATEIIGKIMVECYGAVHEEEPAKNAALKVAEAWDIEVEPPPILPGVTKGKWDWVWRGPKDDPSECVEVHSDGKVRIYTQVCGKASSDGHTREEAVANGKLNAASKELMEAAVKGLRERFPCGEHSISESGYPNAWKLWKACEKAGASSWRGIS